MPNRYPKLAIRSKNELAKHISHKGFSFKQAIDLINDVRSNFNTYWKDSKASIPGEDKYIRSAAGKPLGRLLKKINTMVFAPHDKILPGFIFGGIGGRDHIQATASLLGKKRYRTLLKGDIKRFFEQVKYDRVISLLKNKCKCSFKAAKLLADLCCLPLGPKGSTSPDKSIARGFATSSRLAVWCNLEVFLRLDWLVKKYLKGHDPRLMIFVDDIGITASKVDDETMEKLYVEIDNLFKNVGLPLKPEKKRIRSYIHKKGMEILGSRMGRNKLSLGGRTRAKLDKIKDRLKQPLSPDDRAREKSVYKSIQIYKNRVENITK
jgi:hypothetical protein